MGKKSLKIWKMWGNITNVPVLKAQGIMCFSYAFFSMQQFHGWVNFHQQWVINRCTSSSQRQVSSDPPHWKPHMARVCGKPFWTFQNQTVEIIVDHLHNHIKIKQPIVFCRILYMWLSPKNHVSLYMPLNKPYFTILLVF